MSRVNGATPSRNDGGHFARAVEEIRLVIGSVSYRRVSAWRAWPVASPSSAVIIATSSGG